MMRIRNIERTDPESLNRLVQLEVRGEFVAGFGSSLHIDALEKCLEAESLEYDVVNLGDEECPVRGPSIEGRECRVVGMGRMLIDFANKRYGMPCGSSGDYGLTPHEGHSQLLVQELDSQGWTRIG